MRTPQGVDFVDTAEEFIDVLASSLRQDIINMIQVPARFPFSLASPPAESLEKHFGVLNIAHHVLDFLHAL
jgi:hypothetical protein